MDMKRELATRKARKGKGGSGYNPDVTYSPIKKTGIGYATSPYGSQPMSARDFDLQQSRSPEKMYRMLPIGRPYKKIDRSK